MIYSHFGGVLLSCVVHMTTISLRNPPTREADAGGDVHNTTRTENNREKQSTQYFNEVRQRAYVLGPREREILLIQQSIQINTEDT